MRPFSIFVHVMVVPVGNEYECNTSNGDHDYEHAVQRVEEYGHEYCIRNVR